MKLMLSKERITEAIPADAIARDRLRHRATGRGGIGEIIIRTTAQDF
jgi:hypothetical protein